MPEIKVTYAALTSAGADIAATSAHLTGQLDELAKFVAPMVATWTGASAQTYQLAQQQWNNSQKDMAVVLQEAGRFVQQAEEAYRAADRAVQKNFSAT